MEKNIFLIDSNAFLTPSKHYYRFSFAPSYWKQINELAGRGHIKTIDKVRKEVCPRKKERKKRIRMTYNYGMKIVLMGK